MRGQRDTGSTYDSYSIVLKRGKGCSSTHIHSPFEMHIYSNSRKKRYRWIHTTILTVVISDAILDVLASLASLHFLILLLETCSSVK